MISCSLGEGTLYEYSVPAKDQPPRIAYGSCAGFFSLQEMKKVKDKNAMWKVLAVRQGEAPFHLTIMGGVRCTRTSGGTS